VYAGDEPNSLTLCRNLLYVLDGSVAGNGIRGFRVASQRYVDPAVALVQVAELPDRGSRGRCSSALTVACSW
jgi:hypothetical protein